MEGRRRTGLAVALAGAVAGLLLAGIGSALSVLGFELPTRLGEALGTGAAVLFWMRWLLLPALALGVARARESVS